MVVYATALPSPSMTETWVVSGDSLGIVPWPMSSERDARAGSKSAKRCAAYALSTSVAMGVG